MIPRNKNELWSLWESYFRNALNGAATLVVTAPGFHDVDEVILTASEVADKAIEAVTAKWQQMISANQERPENPEAQTDLRVDKEKGNPSL